MKAVLFDMDGVLLDSEEFIQRAGIEMFREKGYTVRAEDFLEFTGMGEDRYLGGVAEKYGIPFDLEKDKARTYGIYRELVRGKLSPLNGAKRFIGRCRDRELKLALASSADRIKIDINLEEAGFDHDTFQAIVSGSDIRHLKPDPGIFIRAAEDLDVQPGQCLVIEDAVSGVRAGKAAGSKVLAITTSFTREELSEADWIAEDLEQVGDEVFEW